MAFQIIVRCDALGMFAADIYFTEYKYLKYLCQRFFQKFLQSLKNVTFDKKRVI